MSKVNRVKTVSILDTSFIEEDEREYGKPRGDDANTRRSKDGASATMNNEKHFCFNANALVN